MEKSKIHFIPEQESDQEWEEFENFIKQQCDGCPYESTCDGDIDHCIYVDGPDELSEEEYFDDGD